MKQIDLPIPFIEMMQTLLGDKLEAYLNSFEENKIGGIRVNTAKLSTDIFETLVPFPVTRVPWISNGYYYEEGEKPSKDPYYYAGLYYLQEPSAMTPASLLPITPGDMVLDLCAAPGGKSTELGAKLKEKGMLVANDISSSRAKALLKNLEILGIPNICVTSEAPEKLREAFPMFFDKILVDAPCSGEGMFRKDPDMIKSWMERGPEYYAAIQREIMTEAVQMLKPGGLLLYSTCTFSPLENEETIEFVLERYPEMELLKLPLFEGSADGIGLSGCLRLFPHKLKGEGHFVALLKKRGELVLSLPVKRKPLGSEDRLVKELQQFLEQINRQFDPNRIQVKQDMVYYLPEGFPTDLKLRYLRTGLWMGTLKNQRFEPSQALAMSLKKEEFICCMDLKREDERVIRYLKGETLTLLPCEKDVVGWCLICVDGFPLGFAKGCKKTLKNKYYPGWRWM